MPQLGFGVWQVGNEAIVPAVRAALKDGYRLIDTAAIYGNEEGVGEALQVAIVPREEVYVTTKLWNPDHARAAEAMEESLGRLRLDYVDLYLIHWPTPKQNRYVEAWMGLVELQKAGKARSIGVSNFTKEHLQEVIDATGVVPSVNQIELHPLLPQKELRDFHTEHGIVTESWSPLGRGKLMEDPVLVEIGRKHGKTAAQVVLRWHLDLGLVVIPKSVTPSRIEENFDVFDFRLDSGDMDRIASLETGERMGGDPNTANYGVD
ncbi:2,5-didehydrogluconate reductase DkgA [soil metagenome]